MHDEQGHDQWHGNETTFAEWEAENGWTPAASITTRLRIALIWALLIGGCVLVWWAIGVLTYITIRGAT